MGNVFSITYRTITPYTFNIAQKQDMDIHELTQFRKPGRYIGNEWNLPLKKVTEETVKMCWCFPDLYELGMSTLSGRIIVGLLNAHPHVYGDRVFLPDMDYQGYLRTQGNPLRSLQLGLPLSKFDIIGFTLNYELNYVNFLNMLQLSGIPLHADRREGPVVGIGGCANPLPLSEFIDFCFLGEIEASPELLDLCAQLKQISKTEFLCRLADVPGVFVPRSVSSQEKALERVYVRDLNASYYPSDWLVPYVSIVHDRIYIEAARGCPRKCAFCQARSLYFPYRERDPDSLIKRTLDLYKATGYEDISLLALSVSDYSGIEQVLSGLIAELGKYGVKISLPSLRATDFTGTLSSWVSKIKKSGITIAVETASSRLQEKMNKQIEQGQIFDALERASSCGYRRFKFYFMTGLPTEEYSDLEETMRFIEETNRFLKRKNPSAQLNLNFSHFIPKPFTLLENEGMDSYDSLKRKTGFIYERLKKYRNIHIAVSRTEESIVESVLSRGDAALGRVLEYVLQKQKDFSQGRADFSLWEEACRENKLDYGEYIYRKKEKHCWSRFAPQCGINMLPGTGNL